MTEGTWDQTTKRGRGGKEKYQGVGVLPDNSPYCSQGSAAAQKSPNEA